MQAKKCKLAKCFEKVVRGPTKWTLGEWRVTVYDVIFGELRFLDSYTT